MEIFHKNMNFPEIKFQLSLKTVWLRGSLPKSVPLDFGLEKTFAS